MAYNSERGKSEGGRFFIFKARGEDDGRLGCLGAPSIGVKYSDGEDLRRPHKGRLSIFRICTGRKNLAG